MSLKFRTTLNLRGTVGMNVSTECELLPLVGLIPQNIDGKTLFEVAGMK
jgi:hypothetical protein